MEPFAVRARPTWRAAAQAVSCLILLLASAGFITGGVLRGFGLGGAVFAVLGALGIVLFGAGLAVALGRMLSRRPVLVVDDAGVRRPARWPLPAARGATLEWSRVQAVGALRRGVDGTRKGRQDFLVFLPTEAMVDMVRTAERNRLVVLTLPDVPADRLPDGAAEALRWCVPVGPRWDATLPDVVKEIRRRHAVPVVDRRTK
ncbi:hypothetical protein [Actinomadura rayongensis]|uniref:Uncharacterized protein n=1 Tax=Actinomadura rayongensis TaxID=1429076 RepID=A0A6I4W7R6_9ACTN|nr:hypothetical protein [Actinomadura rayongensis]MXQ63184.1 hypothetical protein [Actinomadura rayongensis]